MSQFDPYHKWLAIPPKDQPPNHYRLLGIERFETDLDVIDAAAEQRISYIRQCAKGPNVADSQKLLNELAAARLTLLAPEKKAAYDRQLRIQLNAGAVATPAVTAASLSLPNWLPPWSLAAVACGLAVTGICLLFALKGGEQAEELPLGFPPPAESSSHGSIDGSPEAPPATARTEEEPAVDPEPPREPARSTVSVARVLPTRIPERVPRKPETPKTPSREPQWLPVEGLLAEFSRASVRLGQTADSTSPAGVGLRFILVRGVWNLDKQIQELIDATPGLTAITAAQLIDCRGYQLERQAAIPGEDAWAGPWESVDPAPAHELLSAAADFEIEHFPSRVLSAVFTMPLPTRYGAWGALASHPALQPLELSDAETQVEHNRNVEAILKHQPDVRPAPLSDSATFERDVYDIRGIRQAQAAGGPDQIRAAPLLFRYLDTAIKPGHAYRYRVRLKLRALQPDAKPAESSATSETPWSLPTAPVVTAPDGFFFPVEIERRPGRDQGVVTMAILQWFTDYGTWARDLLPIAPGQMIGGVRAVRRLNVWKQRFQDEEVEFNTPDLLADTRWSPRVVVAEHPDLELPATAVRRPEDIGILDQFLISDESGVLISQDTESRGTLRAELEQQVTAERIPFEASVSGKSPSQLDQLLNQRRTGQRGGQAARKGENPLRRKSAG